MAKFDRVCWILASILLSLLMTAENTLAGETSDPMEAEIGGRMNGKTGTTVKRALGTESPFEVAPLGGDDELMGPLPEVGQQDNIGELLPQEKSLFSKDAVDPTMFDDMDCHMRNLDLCYAGLMSAGAKMLPETDAELEVRCDEIKAMTSCISVYNQRCGSIKLMSAIMPMVGGSASRSMIPVEVQSIELPMELLDGNTNRNKQTATKIKAIDFLELCEPSAKGTKVNRDLRQKLYQLSKCIQPRMQFMKPCIEDLKNALQLFYEPNRSLPLEPSCCAVSRFRHCARGALDGICGLSSFDQLESTFSSGPGRQLTGVLERACRRKASSFETAYCQEVLPASGVKAPQRRGRKASKLARVLDLFSFAPAQ